ncbi:MAG: hypothetical protein DRI57_14080 [Deltaproteobacteria bacterium]|nr:MAG: hypothetical protein DRI57_14080 [Deltaproteobacteria bacterium]
MNSLISAYKNLIVLFTDKKEISASEFETEFLKLFKKDKSFDENFYEIIKPLFYAVEDFCSYPEIRDHDDLDENQLIEAAKATLERLNMVDDKNEIRIKQLLMELNESINTLPLLINRVVEEKLNEILPAIVKNTLSEELHALDLRGFENLGGLTSRRSRQNWKKRQNIRSNHGFQKGVLQYEIIFQMDH